MLRTPRKTSLRCSKCCSTPATQNEVLLRLRCCVGAFVLMVLRGLFSMESFPLYGDFTGTLLYGDFSSLRGLCGDSSLWRLFLFTPLYGDSYLWRLFLSTPLYGDSSLWRLFLFTPLYGDFTGILLYTPSHLMLYIWNIPSYVTVMWVFYGIYPVIPGCIWVLHGQKTPLTVLRGARTSKWRVTWGNLWTDYGCRRW